MWSTSKFVLNWMVFSFVNSFQFKFFSVSDHFLCLSFLLHVANLKCAFISLIVVKSSEVRSNRFTTVICVLCLFDQEILKGFVSTALWLRPQKHPDNPNDQICLVGDREQKASNILFSTLLLTLLQWVWGTGYLLTLVWNFRIPNFRQVDFRTCLHETIKL